MSKIHSLSTLRTTAKMAGHALDAKQIETIANSPEALKKLGVAVSPSFVKTPLAHAMDAGLVNPVLANAGGTPVQFLQEFLAGVVHILTTARRADVLAPIAAVGSWSDEEIVLTAMEHYGTPQLYKDHGQIPLVGYNPAFERRTIVRFELGAEDTMLDSERSSKAGINAMQEKRAAIALAFEILRNDIFFNGFNGGTTRTYGFLNDPNLNAVDTVVVGASTDTEWSTKTVNERISDLLTGFTTLRSQSGDQVDPESTPIRLAIASSVKDLMTEADEGNGTIHTVNRWLRENYPNVTVEAIPELNGASGGENMFYLYAESVDGSGTDDGQTMLQLTPERMRAMNTVQTMRGSQEGYTNATAGCLVKRGYAVYRADGI